MYWGKHGVTFMRRTEEELLAVEIGTVHIPLISFPPAHMTHMYKKTVSSRLGNGRFSYVSKDIEFVSGFIFSIQPAHMLPILCTSFYTSFKRDHPRVLWEHENLEMCGLRAVHLKGKLAQAPEALEPELSSLLRPCDLSKAQTIDESDENVDYG